MEATKPMKRVAAALFAAAIASCAFAGSAFAATVHGADFHGSGSVLESGNVDVLDVDGTAGETVFLTVKRDGTAIAQNLPYTIEQDADAADGAEYAGIATLDIANLDLDALDGSYVIEAYSDRAGKTKLYSGALYGVYADLPDGTSKLIGTRTASADELTARTFEPAETLYAGGRTYRLSGTSTSDGGSLHFLYEAYDESTTVDGVIKYTDATGSVIASTKIPGLAYGEERSVSIPTVVTADNGDLYRTVFFAGSVTAVNPGQTSFSIYCAKMSDATKALAGFYVATIQMVDGDGDVIATDSVDVTGEFIYTAPSVIYKTETVKGEQAVITYKIDQSPTIRLSAANDGVLNQTRTIKVAYAQQDRDSSDITVTFNLIDGSKRVNEEGRNLGTQQATVTKSDPTAEPPATIEANGTTYYLAGSASDYAYTWNSGVVPSVDVYYTPAGYTAPGAYDVTVNYVNILTNDVIESHAYVSDPNENSRITIDVPETFSADGADYMRLDGQGDSIAHSYYSGISTYTVYYRNSNDTLTSGTVINRIRVIYEDGGTTTTTVDGGTTTTVTDGGTTTTTTTTTVDGGTTTTTEGADGTASEVSAQSLQLNSGRTYNVMDGDGNNATLTNESGVDSNTERIADSETPLASGFDKGASSSAASSFAGMAQWLLPAAIIVVVAIVAIGVVMWIRRRHEDDYEA